MLFNSYLFIFCFLPIVWAIFHLLKALSITQNSSVYMTLAKGFLVLASLFFYAYWKLIYLPILLGSMLVNYGVVRGILRGRNGGGGELRRVGFLRRDSACSDKSPILRRGLAHYRLDKSLRPRLESGDFSSTILESKSGTEITNPTASDFAPQNSQNADSSSKILESKSGTETQITKTTQPLESTFSQSHDSSPQAKSFTTQNVFYNKLSAKALLILGIAFNLCLLGIFKYTDFFLENFNLFTKLLALDFAIPLPHILLPLALSFVTFQQIAFLVDCYKQATERESAPESSNPTQEIPYTNFLDYCLFITFFPQLIAGPIVHHKEMMPQFHAMGRRALILGEHSTKSSHSPTAIPKILEEKQAECEKSPFLSLRADLSARQSTQTQTQNLESTFDKTQMDCHATAAALARNDRNNATFGKVDSNLEAENVKNTAQDSRICYEKSLLCEPRKEIRLECLSRELGDAIKDLSRKTSEAVQGEAEAGFFSKAESSKKTESLQMQKPTPSIINWEYIAKGLFIFSIGLFKKVVIADSFAKWANAGFSAVENGAVLNCLESWATSLSYTFELYFDFSGYCDMAIGLGLLFGIILPINFSSPYKALNIAEFWRKWHITLGRFLKEYLYIPLGGNQNIKRVVSLTQNGDYSGDSALISIQGKSLESPCKAPFLAQRYCREPAPQKKESWLNNLLTLRNLFIVAFLSGVWHGAGWGFVIWGSLHGLAMVVHRGYMLLYKKLDSRVVYARFMQSKAYILLCWLLTFNFVNIAWVFFRAENVQGAINLLKGMFGGEVVLPKSLESRLGVLRDWGVDFSVLWIENVVKFESSIFMAIFLVAGFVVTLFLRNSYAITTNLTMRFYNTTICALLLTISLFYIGGNAYSAFLYFNF